MLIILILFLLCTAVQAAFFLRTAEAFSTYRKPTGDPDQPVSVIICARNEGSNLDTLIPELLKQDHPSFEIIIVNDRSEDNTAAVLKKYTDDPRFRTVHIKKLPAGMNGKKNALNTGIEAAVNELILLTDADCLPGSRSWIRGMCAGFEPENAFVLGFSMYNKMPGFLNLLIRFETLWTAIHYIGLALSGFPYMGVGRNLGYRKEVYLQNNGFQGMVHITGGDDDLLVNKLANQSNCAVVMGKEVTTWSVPKTGWHEFYIQKRRHLSVGRYYSPASRVVLGVLSLSHIFGYIFMGILLFHPVYWVYSLGGLVIRTLLLLYTFKKACQKLEIPFSTGKILPMDLVFAIYFPITGISASIGNKVRWN
jgi:cellulose synthase/poly-beta-1,6-N-acetylglucosamine synthase-like glycosyltransferase